jgi:hypothetical protein
MSPPATPLLGTSGLREDTIQDNNIIKEEPIDNKKVMPAEENGGVKEPEKIKNPPTVVPPADIPVADAPHDNGNSDEKSQQSYLALTKLGSGKKEGTETKVPATPKSDPKVAATSKTDSKAPSTPKLDNKIPASPKVAATTSKETGKWAFLHKK